MNKISGKHYREERSLFASKDLLVEKCQFSDGESPLKESSNIEVDNCTFIWKYPLWYCSNVFLHDSKLEETARSGIWYIDTIDVQNTLIEAPKTFRKGKHIRLNRVEMPNAKEILWDCHDIKINEVKAEGDYFGFNSSDIEVDNLTLKGNYLFDTCKNVTVRNSILESKDAFWNCENVTIINCTIIGEYLGWNTKNLTIINCKIESHQGLCYIDKLFMRNTEINNSDLILEYCHNLDVEITSVVDSIKNPYDGVISVKGVKELILDPKFIDLSKIKINRR